MFIQGGYDMSMKRKMMTAVAAVVAASMFAGCNVQVNVTDQEPVKEAPKEEAASTETESSGKEDKAAENDLALIAPGYTGLTNLRKEDNDDGTYYYEDMTEDGITVITNMCSPNSQRDGQADDAYAENFVCALVDNDARITGSKEDTQLSETLSYPVYKVDWESGGNEDTRQATGVVILTDKYTFYYGYECPIDMYEDNEKFYGEELATLQLIDLSQLSSGKDPAPANGGEVEEVEIPLPEDETVDDPDSEDKPVGADDMDRSVSDEEEIDYTIDDVAGYWKYEDYDSIYLAMYDSGQFETYDIKTNDVISAGSYTVEDNEITITEDDKDPQTISVISMVRLEDDEGDLLVRYSPEGVSTASSDEEGDGTRLYGMGEEDDIVIEDAGKGFYKIKSQSRECFMKYPYQYYASTAPGSVLYVYDGDVSYATARNLTGEYNQWTGSLNSFKKTANDQFLIEDFNYFYGKYSGASNLQRNMKTRVQNKNVSTIAETTCKMYNGRFKIKCISDLLLIHYDDGVQKLILLNRFYRYGDKNSNNHLSRVSAGSSHVLD